MPHFSTTLKAAILSMAFAATPAAFAQSEVLMEGFSEPRLGRISVSMQSQIDQGIFPGAVTMVARNGRVTHYEAHGFSRCCQDQADD